MNQLAKDVCTEGLFSALAEVLEYYSGDEVTIKHANCDSLAAVFNETIECPTSGCETIASFTRLDGPGVSGSLSLTSHACVIAKLGGQDMELASDWIGELGNQLLGRFKNNLLDYGVSTDLGIPLTSRGILLNSTTSPGDQLDLKVETAAGNIWVTFVLQVGYDHRWRKLPQAASAAAGSVQLF
ncbi:hypothetical protein [Rhodopirellula sp. MGV]|uniref:hypothetical protein n=1 Tax=Rhodopirellula sp. MGV TaxID=2023130 RepID=UPI000B97043E|nr:hypothetical protein [Rhodopirellula sp. MGV]OYP37480.1 hypothetical protein CGZ80_04955 [Rhodopirellula sp. MGV]PNY37882.1 hypothetical protein C2E31_05090 [Rhodopirellula baltica]